MLLVGVVGVIVLLGLSYCFFCIKPNQSKTQVNGAIKILQPKIGLTPDLSEKAEAEWNEGAKIYEQLAAGIKKKESLSSTEQQLLAKYDDTKTSIWDIYGEGDDWSNLNRPENIEATSELKPQNNTVYLAMNAYDISFKNAWIEGVSGYGVGEAITYTFKPDSAKIDTILIYNGYFASKELWLANSRVKRLKLSINNESYCILELQDSMAEQKFKVDLSKWYDQKTSRTLRFEIMEVYQGEKYDDTAITEIYFSGEAL